MSRALRFWEWVVDRLPLRFAPDWLNNWLAWQYWKRVKAEVCCCMGFLHDKDCPERVGTGSPRSPTGDPEK